MRSGKGVSFSSAPLLERENREADRILGLDALPGNTNEAWRLGEAT
jgi:hypothetical protein